MEPEAQARVHIDALLADAGWAVQDRKDYDPTVAAGVAVREFALTTGAADYLATALPRWSNATPCAKSA